MKIICRCEKFLFGYITLLVDGFQKHEDTVIVVIDSMASHIEGIASAGTDQVIVKTHQYNSGDLFVTLFNGGNRYMIF